MEGNVSMLWALVIVAGAFLVIMSLCKTASMSDKQNDEIYKATHRGDNDGDN